MAEPLAYPIPEAAAVAGVSPDTIRKAIHTVDGTPLRAKRVGKKILIPAAELQAWLAALPDA